VPEEVAAVVSAAAVVLGKKPAFGVDVTDVDDLGMGEARFRLPDHREHLHRQKRPEAPAELDVLGVGNGLFAADNAHRVPVHRAPEFLDVDVLDPHP